MQEQATATVEWHNECQNDLNESVWSLSETRDQCRAAHNARLRRLTLSNGLRGALKGLMDWLAAAEFHAWSRRR